MTLRMPWRGVACGAMEHTEGLSKQNVRQGEGRQQNVEAHSDLML